MLQREIDKSCALVRESTPALDEILGWAFPILDHGFIRVISYMGNEDAIVQSARVSYGRGTKSSNEDRNLIRYMMRHRHASPFEMAEIKFHIKLPIFVARQFVRHRTANINEMSARYSILDNEFYIPEPEHMATQSTTNRQGRGDILTPEEAEEVKNLLIVDAKQCYDTYTELLNDSTSADHDPELPSLARELARMNLTLNTYTQWYWKVDLRNLFHFLSLRADSHAQYEIRVYAEKMLEIVKLWVPEATQAFIDYQHEAKSFSRMELKFIRDLIHTFKNTSTDNLVHTPEPEHKHEFNDYNFSSYCMELNMELPETKKILLEEYDLSLREQKELMEKLGLN